MINVTPPPPDGFDQIMEILERHRVQHVIIGGVAASLRGAPIARTLDVDVTPASDEENRKRLARALRELEAELRTPGLDEPIAVPLDERTFTGTITMTFQTRFGPFDVSFRPDGTEGFDDLIRGADIFERRGVKIPVASLADIVRSKRAAGREKDLAHLPILLRLLNQTSEPPA